MGFFDIFKKKQDNAAPAPQEEVREEQRQLDAGLEKTKTGLFSKLARAVAGRSTVDADVLDELEEVLITSDVGVETTVKIIRRIEERVARDKYMNASELQRILREEVAALLEEAHATEGNFGLDARPGEPYVVMVVGVNGAGKTTTIGKLAAQLTKAGRKVWIGAADTVRAAAIDQLKVWADRAGATMLRPRIGGLRHAHLGQGQRRRRRADRHGGPPAQQDQPDERADEDTQRHVEGHSRRTA